MTVPNPILDPRFPLEASLHDESVAHTISKSQSEPDALFSLRSAVRDLDGADRNALNARSQHPLIQEFRPEQLRQQQYRRPASQYGLESEEAAAKGVGTGSLIYTRF